MDTRRIDAHRIHLKLYLDPSAEPAVDRAIPIFHRFIQERRLDELLIDVADYRHVVDGPGVMLIAHHANYALDATDGRPGLLYARKRPAEGSFGERLRGAFRQLLRAAREVEEAGLPGFSPPGDRLAVRIQDRLAAPATDATFAAVEPALRALLAELYGDAGVTLRREEEPGGAFGVRVAAPERPGVATLLERLEAASSAAVAVAG